MEYLEGDTLAQRLEKGALPLDQALKVAVEIADALDKAHRQGIVHRDLKPGNVMLTKTGAKLLDFGLAKLQAGDQATDGLTAPPTQEAPLTQQGAILGTIQYMAPEQLEGKEADARADIFAFGILLYEMLAGVHPFQRTSQSGTIAAILRDSPAPVRQYAKDAPDSARLTLDRLLAKEPRDRHQNFGQVSDDIGRLRDETSRRAVVHDEFTAPAQPSLGMRRTPYVGREKEHAELHAWVDQAIRGQGGIVLIGGEPGVGKTRLVEQVLATAQERSCLTLTGRAYEVEGSPPFIPFVEMVEQCMESLPAAALQTALGDAAPEVARLVPDLRRQFPDMPAPLELPPDQQRRYLFKNFAEFLERVSQPRCIVCLLDDLQWADEATLALLQHLAPQLETWPVLILGTYRDVELDVQRPFAKTLETLRRKRLATRLSLGRLPAGGVQAMLVALGGPDPPARLVTDIYQETEGNPFFVEEVFQHLKDEGVLFGDAGRWRTELDLQDLEVPEGVRLVIGRRLERVSAESQKVLTLGAIVGRSFSLAFLEAIGDVTGDALLTALEESEQAYLIVPTASREAQWDFTHALIRQTLVAGLSLPRRQRLHARVADAIERAADTGGTDHAGDISYHLYQAGALADRARTLRYLTLAGEAALEKAAAREAMVCFDRGLSLLGPDDLQARADLLFKSGQAARSDGTWEVVISRWHEALDLYETLGQGERCAYICSELVFTLTYLQMWDQVLELAPLALRMATPGAAGEGRLLSGAGAAYVNKGYENGEYYDRGNECFARSVGVAEASGDPHLLGQVLFDQLAPFWGCLRIPEMVSAGERSVDLVRSAGDVWMLTDGLSVTAIGFLDLGRLRDAARMVKEYQPLAERVGNLRALLLLNQTVGPLSLMLAGDLDGFVQSSKDHRAINDRAGFPWANLSHSFLGLAAMWRGDREDSLAESKRAVSAELPGPWDGVSRGSAFLCRAFFDDESAVSRPKGNDLLPQPGQPNTIGSWHYLQCAVQGLALLGRQEEAGQLYPLTIECLDQGALLINYAFELIQKTAGIAAACGGRWREAEHHYVIALRQTEEIPHMIEQPEVRRWYAQMLFDRDAPGDRDKARTLLGEATQMYRMIGMPKHLEMVEKMSAEL